MSILYVFIKEYVNIFESSMINGCNLCMKHLRYLPAYRCTHPRNPYAYITYELTIIHSEYTKFKINICRSIKIFMVFEAKS